MTPQEAAQKLYWIKIDELNHIIEIYCDHHMLSGVRTCESKFVLEHVLNIRPKGHKAWSLVFGAWLHYCFETFYNYKRDNDQNPIQPDIFLNYGKDKWHELKLDAYKEESKYKKVGGLDGGLSLLTMYYAYYHTLRMRVVDTEISFGFEKEVPLGEYEILLDSTRWTVKCYLTGRIDLVVDNGFKIGPVDHKHTLAFRGDEHTKFNPHDGITGYMFALNSLMRKVFPKYFEQNKVVQSGWIYHISGTMPIPKDKTKQPIRFKCTPIDKTVGQYEEYRLRQLSTFKRITSIIFGGETPQWNTNACPNIFMSPCEYRPIHESISSEWGNIINSHYNVVTPWNPLEPEKSAIVRDEVLSEKTLLQIGGLSESSEQE